jgi:predicted O-methyltransferase YrrM
MYLVLFLCHFDCKSTIFFVHMQVFLYFCKQIQTKMNIFDYIEQHSSPESDVLKRITRSTHLEVINPRMLSGHVQGRVLSMISQMIQPQRILELGTFTGYSALCLAEGLTEDGKLITIEHNDEMEPSIRRNLGLTPLGEKIELVIGDAIEVLRRLDEKFDLIFIDADKKQYCDYLDLVIPLLRPGGWILADNTLWDGHIIDPAYDKDKQTIALRAFNDKVMQDERLDKVILPLRDGLTIIRKKPLITT